MSELHQKLNELKNTIEDELKILQAEFDESTDMTQMELEGRSESALLRHTMAVELLKRGYRHIDTTLGDEDVVVAFRHPNEPHITMEIKWNWWNEDTY